MFILTTYYNDNIVSEIRRIVNGPYNHTYVNRYLINVIIILGNNLMSDLPKCQFDLQLIHFAYKSLLNYIVS